MSDVMRAAAAARSRVFRQVVAMEIFVLVPPDAELPHTDLEAVVRDALMDLSLGRCSVVPGEPSVTDVQELASAPTADREAASEAARAWVVTFAEPGGAYTAAEAVVVECDDVEQAAEEGLAQLLEAFPDTACANCEQGSLADHVNVLPYDDVVPYEVGARPRRKCSPASGDASP